MRLLAVLSLVLWSIQVSYADTVPDWWHMPVQWRVGVGVSGGAVPGTNNFLRGMNSESRVIDRYVSGDLRGGFGFNPHSRQGMLYRGVYQGIGLDVRSMDAGSLLGTPVSVYVYQGAPIVRFSRRLWLGYEWRFGAAFGWRHSQGIDVTEPDRIVGLWEQAEPSDDEMINVAVSTPVTAHMGIALKLHYQIAPRWQMSLGVEGAHFSNGNTSWPNAGVNTIGASLGVTYLLDPEPEIWERSAELEAEADRPDWFLDIMAYGAWRKRQVLAGDYGQLCPGRFGVAGLQIAPMRKFNRWVAAGVALDLQYDESAGLSPYWVEHTSGDDIKFYRPPFGKQVSVGLSAHAELTMPVFSVNAGLGYDMVCPEGNQRFYQSLGLKTFVTRRLFLNVGYRLGNFKYPQNLMLGIGFRW